MAVVVCEVLTVLDTDEVSVDEAVLYIQSAYLPMRTARRVSLILFNAPAQPLGESIAPKVTNPVRVHESSTTPTLPNIMVP